VSIENGNHDERSSTLEPDDEHGTNQVGGKSSASPVSDGGKLWEDGVELGEDCVPAKQEEKSDGRSLGRSLQRLQNLYMWNKPMVLTLFVRSVMAQISPLDSEEFPSAL
jgi:hypothetical protein